MQIQFWILYILFKYFCCNLCWIIIVGYKFKFWNSISCMHTLHFLLGCNYLDLHSTLESIMSRFFSLDSNRIVLKYKNKHMSESIFHDIVNTWDHFYKSITNWWYHKLSILNTFLQFWKRIHVILNLPPYKV